MSELVDTGGLSIQDLMQAEGKIGEAARRLVESLDDPNGVISAFQSWIGFGSAIDSKA